MMKKDQCPYCGGPSRCVRCGISCADAKGLTVAGYCAKCSNLINQIRTSLTNLVKDTYVKHHFI